VSTKYKVRDQEKLHFITITVIDWVDLFTRPILKHVIVDSLKYCIKNKGLEINAHWRAFAKRAEY
jgi:putative transposase